MRRFCLAILAGIAMLAAGSLAVQAQSEGPYKVLKTAKVGGDGGFDYVYADSDRHRLYIPRPAQTGAHVAVFNLDISSRPAIFRIRMHAA